MGVLDEIKAISSPSWDWALAWAELGNNTMTINTIITIRSLLAVMAVIGAIMVPAYHVCLEMLTHLKMDISKSTQNWQVKNVQY